MSPALSQVLRFLKTLPLLPPTPTADPTTLTSRKLTTAAATGGATNTTRTPTSKAHIDNIDNNNTKDSTSNAYNPPSSSSSLAFRVAYNLIYYFLYLVLVAFLCVTPGDLIKQAAQNNQRANIVSIAACYLVTIVIVSFAYSARLYVNRTVLASIPKGWVPVEKGEVPRVVRPVIVRGLGRSAAIAWRARPRMEEEEWEGGEEGIEDEVEGAGVELAPVVSGEGGDHQQAQAPGAGTRLRKAISVPFERLSKRKRANKTTHHAGNKKRPNGCEEKQDHDDTAYGINIMPAAEPAARSRPWGKIEHPGWAPPASADLPGLLHYEAVIAELPNLIEAKALTLGLLASRQGSRSNSPMSLAGSGDPRQQQQPQPPQPPPVLDPDAAALLQRPECMGLREYLTRLTELGMLVPTLLPADPRDQSTSSASAAPSMASSAARPTSLSPPPNGLRATNTTTATTVTADFLGRYEAARFSARALTNAQFRALMHRFADVLRSLRAPDLAVLTQYQDAESDDGRSEGEYYDEDEGGEDDDEDGQTGDDQEYYGADGDPGPSRHGGGGGGNRGGLPPYYSSDDAEDIDNDAPRGTNPSSPGGTPQGTVRRRNSTGRGGRRADGRSGGAGNDGGSILTSSSSSLAAGTTRTATGVPCPLHSPARSRPNLATRHSSGSTWPQSQFCTAPTTPKSALTLQPSAVGGREGGGRRRRGGRNRRRKGSKSALSASSSSASLTTSSRRSVGFFDDLAQTRPDLFEPPSFPAGGGSSGASDGSLSVRSGLSVGSQQSARTDGTTRHHSTTTTSATTTTANNNRYHSTGSRFGRGAKGKIKEGGGSSRGKKRSGAAAAAAATADEEAGPWTNQAGGPRGGTKNNSSSSSTGSAGVGNNENGNSSLFYDQHQFRHLHQLHHHHHHHRSRRPQPQPQPQPPRRPRPTSAAANSLDGSSGASTTGTRTSAPTSGHGSVIIRLAQEGDGMELPYVFGERAGE